jgi:hypothetical protein
MQNTLVRRTAQLTDSERENGIQFAYRALMAARDKPSQFAGWRVMRRLIRSRTPEAVARLERDRGLVPSESHISSRRATDIRRSA